MLSMCFIQAIVVIMIILKFRKPRLGADLRNFSKVICQLPGRLKKTLNTYQEFFVHILVKRGFLVFVWVVGAVKNNRCLISTWEQDVM